MPGRRMIRVPTKPQTVAAQRRSRNRSPSTITLISPAKIGAVKASAVTRAIGVRLKAVKNANMAITLSSDRTTWSGSRWVRMEPSP